MVTTITGVTTHCESAGTSSTICHFRNQGVEAYAVAGWHVGGAGEEGIPLLYAGEIVYDDAASLEADDTVVSRFSGMELCPAADESRWRRLVEDRVVYEVALHLNPHAPELVNRVMLHERLSEGKQFTWGSLRPLGQRIRTAMEAMGLGCHDDNLARLGARSSIDQRRRLAA